MRLHLRSKLGFGKYGERTVRKVIDVDPDYIEWALNEVDDFELDDNAMRYLGERFWRTEEWPSSVVDQFKMSVPLS